MEKKNIHIEMKEPNGKPFLTNVPVDEEPTDEKMISIGKDLKETFWRSKNIIIQFEVFNSISKTWMCMMSYYCNEDRLVKHT